MIEIQLSKGKVALIDDADFEIVSAFKWHAYKPRHVWYAQTTVRSEGGRQSNIQMHRMILGLTDRHIHTDHINGNGLDNQRDNLRPCWHAQNQWNSGAQINNSSGFKGVCFHKGGGKWMAQIMANGKHKYLGLFVTPEEAYAAYCAAARDLHGEFANYGANSPMSI